MSPGTDEGGDLFGGLVGRLAATYEREGRSWPVFSAAVTLARGRAKLDRAGFGRQLAVTAHSVAELEQGRRHPALAPGALGAVAPDIDWGRLGVPVSPPPDPSARSARARHPAGRRPPRVLVRRTER